MEAAFGIIDQSEVFACAVDRDHVLEAAWKLRVRAHFAVDSNVTRTHNHLHFARYPPINTDMNEALI